MKKIYLIKHVILVVVIFSSITAYKLVNWTNINFADLSFDQIIFHLKVPLEGSENSLVKSLFEYVLFPSIIILIVSGLIIISCKFAKKKTFLNIEYNGAKTKKRLRILVWPILYIEPVLLFFAFFVLLTSIFQANTYFNLFEYVRAQTNATNFIEEHYVVPSNDILKFPDEKRNLIYIYLESMENTFADKKSGGAYIENYIPELVQLAENNISFSNANLLGGFKGVYGTQWTMAAMFSQSTGLPLKLPIDGNAMSEISDFFPGVTGIGEILESHGYKNILLLGSDATFGGRRSFFNQHGNYEILDYHTALQNKLIIPDYFVWWGYEDRKLFQFAKNELLDLSKSQQPFNFTMLTADTHHQDGYVCELCDNKFDVQYGNVLSCSSRQVDSFVKWIQEQKFYENTTIVLVGDHTTMDTDFADYIDTDFERTIYNTYINSAVDLPVKQLKNRSFSSLDLFPTTLSSLGVEIEGNQLGLGVNLFSDSNTLLEEYGSGFSQKLSSISKFYNEKFVFPRK